MLRLDFTRADLNLPEALAATCRASISGVQDKVQLWRKRGGFCVVESAFRFSQGTVSEAFHGQAPRALHCKPSDKLYQNGEDSALVITKTERIPLW
jgi:hypothetical protein